MLVRCSLLITVQIYLLFGFVMGNFLSKRWIIVHNCPYFIASYTTDGLFQYDFACMDTAFGLHLDDIHTLGQCVDV